LVGLVGTVPCPSKEERIQGHFEGKVTVPTDDEMNASNMSADDVKKMKRIRELNDVAYEALLLLIDGKSQSGRVAFKQDCFWKQVRARRFQMGMRHWHGHN
jgi:hypothetical protein